MIATGSVSCFKETRLQHHGQNVALRHYDKELPSLKANTVVWMSEINGDKFEAEDIPTFIENKRKKRDEEDRAASQGCAKRRRSQNVQRRATL
jgi:hypothetical protein